MSRDKDIFFVFVICCSIIFTWLSTVAYYKITEEVSNEFAVRIAQASPMNAVISMPHLIMWYETF